MFRVMIASMFLISGLAYGGEGIDPSRGKVRNPEFGSTVILKIDKRTGSLKMVRTKDVVGSSREAKKLLKEKAKYFKKVPKSKVRRNVNSTDVAFAAEDPANPEFDPAGWYSWYYYYPSYYYYYPYYYGYYYGYYNYYTPYYYYSYGNYNYYYYGWYYYW